MTDVNALEIADELLERDGEDSIVCTCFPKDCYFEHGLNLAPKGKVVFTASAHILSVSPRIPQLDDPFLFVSRSHQVTA